MNSGLGARHGSLQGRGNPISAAWVSVPAIRAPTPHGTPCAGVAIAEQNGTGTVGVAPGCAFLAVRFPLNLSDGQMAKMFELISTKADVVSCSWGYGPGNFPMSTTLRNTITDLAKNGGKRGKGLVICIAAGNNNCPVKDVNNTRTYRYRNNQGGISSYSGPINRWIAAHPDVITVSACTSLKTRSAYSSWGEDINVCAPSNNFDDLNQISTTGLGIFTTDNEGHGLNTDFTSGSRYTPNFGGTSSATPTIAGVCGLVISCNPALTAKEVREVIESTADKDLDISSETHVNEPGDFDSNGFSLWFGHGKVNAAEAVELASPKTITETQMTETADDTPIQIPDTGTEVESTIDSVTEGTVTEIRIKVEIDHTYIGDLRIDLVAPDGTAVTLHNHEDGSDVNLHRTWSSRDFAPLAGLVGKPAQGAWRLRIADTWFWDQGTLRSWRLAARVANAGPDHNVELPAKPASRRPKKGAAQRKRARTKATN